MNPAQAFKSDLIHWGSPICSTESGYEIHEFLKSQALTQI